MTQPLWYWIPREDVDSDGDWAEMPEELLAQHAEKIAILNAAHAGTEYFKWTIVEGLGAVLDDEDGRNYHLTLNEELLGSLRRTIEDS